MDADLYQQVKNIVAEAVELPTYKIGSYIKKKCGDNSEPLQEVESLLSLNMDDNFLDNSPIEVTPTTIQQEILTGKIGRITIVNLLARSGMGEVYAGFDEIIFDIVTASDNGGNSNSVCTNDGAGVLDCRA